MTQKTRRVFLLSVMGSLLVAAGPYQPPVAITIKAPCLKDSELNQPRLDLQACSYVLRSKSASPGNVGAGMLDQLDQRLRDRINCFYQGVIPDINNTQGASGSYGSTSSCQGGVPVIPGQSAKPVCNMADGEDPSNHLSQSCGAFRGDWESAQDGGLWVQAVKKFRNDIDTEISTNYTLGVSARCQPLANDYVSVSYPDPTVSPSPGAPPSAQELSNAITAGSSPLPPEAYTGGIDFCQDDTTFQGQVTALLQSPSSQSNPTALQQTLNAIPKAAACGLAASRSNRVSMFANIAECELWSRVDYFMALFADNETQNFANLVNDCFNYATDVGNKVGHDNSSQSDGEAAGNAAFDKCYQPKVRDFFKRIDNTYLPGKFDTRNERAPDHGLPGLPGQGLLFALGSLAGAGAGSGGTKRRRYGRFLKKFAFFFGINAVVLSFATYYSLGGCCGPDPQSPPTPHNVCTGKTEMDPGDYPSALTKQCCQAAPNDSLMQESVQKDYKQCVACGGSQCAGNTQSQDQGNLNFQGALGNNAQVAQLAGLSHPAGGSAPVVAPKVNAPTFSNRHEDAATAGGIAAPAPNTGMAQGPSISQSGPGAGTRGSGAAGGGGSGMGADLGSATTAAASDGGTPNGAPSGLPTDKDGMYAGGGAAGAGKGGPDGGSGWGHGGLAGPDNGTGVTEDNFTPDSSGMGGGVATGEDPADYFTRIGLGENIFKVVEKRYRTKTMGWVEGDLKKPLAPPPAAPAVKK